MDSKGRIQVLFAVILLLFLFSPVSFYLVEFHSPGLGFLLSSGATSTDYLLCPCRRPCLVTQVHVPVSLSCSTEGGTKEPSQCDRHDAKCRDTAGKQTWLSETCGQMRGFRKLGSRSNPTTLWASLGHTPPLGPFSHFQKLETHLHSRAMIGIK